MPEHLRSCALHDRKASPPPFRPRPWTPAEQQLRRIGVLLNQAVRRLHEAVPNLLRLRPPDPQLLGFEMRTAAAIDAAIAEVRAAIADVRALAARIGEKLAER